MYFYCYQIGNYLIISEKNKMTKTENYNLACIPPPTPLTAHIDIWSLYTISER